MVAEITGLLALLARDRPLFHSEADFQHALAWAIHQNAPHGSVRLEMPIRHQDKPPHIDIWVAERDAALAIELKYKTRALSVRVGLEQFDLSNQSAQDIGRYDFVKDIERLEQIALRRPGTRAYAVLLTNDSSYWAPPRDRHPIDERFRLHEGRVLAGSLAWGPGASQGTMRGRERPLQLLGNYSLHWQDYSRFSATTYGTFRYLAVSITCSTARSDPPSVL